MQPLKKKFKKIKKINPPLKKNNKKKNNDKLKKERLKGKNSYTRVFTHIL